MASDSRERSQSQLFGTIWKIATDLRGSVDGWDFKQYVLGLLLYRFISENLTDYINAQEKAAGADEGFDYTNLSDEKAEFGRADTVREKGFFILPSELFSNVRRYAKSDPDLNEALAKVFRSIEGSAKGTASEDDIKGLFDDLDVNSSKLGSTVAKRNDKLVKLLDAIGDMQFGRYPDSKIDAFGDAYEYLMGMYASSAASPAGSSSPRRR